MRLGPHSLGDRGRSSLVPPTRSTCMISPAGRPFLLFSRLPPPHLLSMVSSHLLLPPLSPSASRDPFSRLLTMNNSKRCDDRAERAGGFTSQGGGGGLSCRFCARLANRPLPIKMHLPLLFLHPLSSSLLSLTDHMIPVFVTVRCRRRRRRRHTRSEAALAIASIFYFSAWLHSKSAPPK